MRILHPEGPRTDSGASENPPPGRPQNGFWGQRDRRFAVACPTCLAGRRFAVTCPTCLAGRRFAVTCPTCPCRAAAPGGIRSAFGEGNEDENPPPGRPQNGFWGQRDRRFAVTCATCLAGRRCAVACPTCPCRAAAPGGIRSAFGEDNEDENPPPGRPQNGFWGQRESSTRKAPERILGPARSPLRCDLRYVLGRSPLRCGLPYVPVPGGRAWRYSFCVR